METDTVVDAVKTQDKAVPERQKTIDGFANFVSRLGIGPQQQNNLSASGYTFNLWTRNRLQLEAGYRGSWLVGQVIDVIADDMTRAGITISTNEGAENITKLQAAMSRLQIWQSICSLIKWSRLYGGAIGVLQIEGQNLGSPLNLETIGKNQFKGISVYDRCQLNPDLTNVISTGADMGLPKYYNIILGGNLSSVSDRPNGQVTVHHSRCIRMIGIELPFWQAITEMMWGESVLERLWDRLISFDDATLSAANLIDRAQLRTVRVDGLREIIAAGGPAYDGLVQMFEMVRQFQSSQGLTILDKADEMQFDTYSFAGLSDILLQFGQQVSGASGIPLIRLFGQSPAGLSATGDADIRMYYDNINAQQEARMRNPMETIIQVMYRSLFGLPCPEDLEFQFTPLWQMSAMDKATISKSNTETILAAFQEGAIDKPTMMSELRDTQGEFGLFGNITDEMIEEAKFEEPPLPMEGQLQDPKESDDPAVKNIDHKPNFWTKIKSSLNKPNRDPLKGVVTNPRPLTNPPGPLNKGSKD